MKFYKMSLATISKFKGKNPKFAKEVFLANGAHIIGDVVLGESTNVWFNTVIRGDVHSIEIGKRTNVQDNTTIHVTSKTGPVKIGDDVTIGHGAIVHACTIENLCLIGMGSIILDGAWISSQSLVAAGSVVSPGKKFPSGVLIKGAPAVVARDLTPNEMDFLPGSAQHYLATAEEYFELCEKIDCEFFHV